MIRNNSQFALAYVLAAELRKFGGEFDAMQRTLQTRGQVIGATSRGARIPAVLQSGNYTLQDDAHGRQLGQRFTDGMGGRSSLGQAAFNMDI